MCSSRYSWLQEHVEKFICAIPGTAIDPRTCSSLLSRFNRLCDFSFTYGIVDLDADGSLFDLKRYVIYYMNKFYGDGNTAFNDELLLELARLLQAKFGRDSSVTANHRRDFVELRREVGIRDIRVVSSACIHVPLLGIDPSR